MSITLETPQDARAAQPPVRPRALRGVWSVAESRYAAVALGLFALGGLLQLSGAPTHAWWAAYLTCYLVGGWLPARDGLSALRRRVLDVDLLMVVAAIAAAAIGQVLDGALLIVIFSTSGALEAVATRRTADSVRALLDLAPPQATRLDPGGEQSVPTTDLQVGDLILVRPGERIGADADVTQGWSEVDEATITGEPFPVGKQPGDSVFAGTMNGTGALTVRVTSDPGETLLARMVGLVEEASATKATRQLVIERVERVYSAAVVAVTVALIAVPLLLGSPLREALLRAMTFMIVASPCALVLATMPPLLAAIATAGRNGVLIKSAPVMERLATVTHVAFDKTGTLTRGTPVVTAVRPLPGYDPAELLAVAAAAEHDSEHPVAAAVRAAAARSRLRARDVTDFRAVPGIGVTARIDGEPVAVGAPRLLGSAGGDRAAALAIVRELESAGHTAAVVVIDDVAAGVIALGDELRPNARAAVADLARLTGNPAVLLSGDNQRAVEHAGEQVDIHDAHGDLLPEGKVAAIRERQGAGASLLLVGDGINDAPALATADLGFAMGRRGSDLALDTADAIIVRDDLASVADTVRLARRARRVVRANLAIAATVIVTLTAWDLLGTLPLPLGVAGHEGSTIVVALNGLRLLRRRPGGLS